MKVWLIDDSWGTTYDPGIVTLDAESTQTSRQRLMASAKALFARSGFERTSTATIAREAGTSESQLIRYYHTKNGLLEAIFNECWRTLMPQIQEVVVAAPNARDALAGVLECVSEAFGRDPDLAQLILFEGRRMRGDSTEIALSKGFTDFAHLIRLLVARGKKDGTFREELNDEAVASSLIGATEGMIRDRLIAHRAGKESPFADSDMRSIFLAILRGLGT